jgi:pimeloyl-ACP methyl ester carboxylesterase
MSLDFLEPLPGRRLAVARRDGRGPTLVFLPGYASDMTGGKATAIDAWAAEQGRAMVRFDYGGCGRSPGDFEAQRLDDWRNDVIAVIDAVEGPLVLVGSSMGGWLMLLAASARPTRVAGLVGIAAAPDFTSWGFSEAEKATIRTAGRL